MLDQEYYQPSSHGAERAVAERLSKLRRIVEGRLSRMRPRGVSAVE